MSERDSSFKQYLVASLVMVMFYSLRIGLNRPGSDVERIFTSHVPIVLTDSFEYILYKYMLNNWIRHSHRKRGELLILERPHVLFLLIRYFKNSSCESVDGTKINAKMFGNNCLKTTLTQLLARCCCLQFK